MCMIFLAKCRQIVLRAPWTDFDDFWSVEKLCVWILRKPFFRGQCWRGFLSEIQATATTRSLFRRRFESYKRRVVGAAPMIWVLQKCFYERYFSFAWSYATPTPPIYSVLSSHLMDILILKSRYPPSGNRTESIGGVGNGVWPYKTKVPFIKIN